VTVLCLSVPQEFFKDLFTADWYHCRSQHSEQREQRAKKWT